MISVVGWFVLVVPAADAPSPRLVEETWEVARIDGSRIGHVHTTVTEVEGPPNRRLRTTAEMDLTLRRFGALVRVWSEQGTEETSEDRVVGVFLRQGKGPEQLSLTGSLEEGRMHVQVDGGRVDRRLDWPAGIVGWHAREHLFERRRPKPGEEFSFLRYEPMFNSVVTVRVRVRDAEEVALPSGTRRLTRVDMAPDALEARGTRVQPPSITWWLDERFVPVQRTLELEGLGTVTLTRSSRDVAQAPPTPGRGADIGHKTLVPLARRVPQPYETRSVVYRVRIAGEARPALALAQGTHQEARNVEGDAFELHVHPPRAPRPNPAAAPPAAEYLAACHFIDCDDEQVRALAARAIGDEKDPWKKARRVERWVKQSMRPDNTAPMAPASRTARDLRGDCRHYALLTAALCRAASVPARVAVGLLYVERSGKPFLGFHMWTEVWVEGQWLGLDAVLGRGGVDATHIKVADHSWSDVQSLTPLLPVNRLLGKIEIEVLHVEGSE